MITKPALTGALLAAWLLAVPAQLALGHDQPAGPMMGRGPMMGGQACPPGWMGYGPMGPGGMGPGHMCPGHMGPGMMGYGHMGPGHMGYGHMGPGHMGPCTMGGGMGPGWGRSGGQQALDVDDVRAMLERHLAWRGNPRLKLGEVKAADDDTIVAEIVTLDDSLVQRLKVDRRTGWMRQAE